MAVQQKIILFPLIIISVISNAVLALESKKHFNLNGFIFFSKFTNVEHFKNFRFVTREIFSFECYFKNYI